jgi:hypothetical protein
VRVRRQVKRHTVEENGEIRTVVEIEAAQKILVGLAATGVLRDDQAGKRLQNFSRTKNRTIREFLAPTVPWPAEAAIPIRSSSRPCTLMVVLTALTAREMRSGAGASAVPMVTGVSLVSKSGIRYDESIITCRESGNNEGAVSLSDCVVLCKVPFALRTCTVAPAITAPDVSIWVKMKASKV